MAKKSIKQNEEKDGILQGEFMHGDGT